MSKDIISNPDVSTFVHKRHFDNDTNELVNCVHPMIIQNPNLKDLIYKYGNYTLMGHQHRIDAHTRRNWIEYFPYSLFKPDRVLPEELSDNYVTDFTTGETYPLFIVVPCGHCELCRASKIDGFAHRCELETQMYAHQPYFITLTYANQYLPKDGVNVKHTQLFLKRFRSRLKYYGFNDHFRYALCAEYGSKKHRPHYHMLVWNLYPTADIKFTKIKSILESSWHMGFTYLSIVSKEYQIKGKKHGIYKPTDCFKYVAKYIAKDSDVPAGANPVFMNTSKRKGGIGAPFLDRHAAYIRRREFISMQEAKKQANPLGKRTPCEFDYVDSFTLTNRHLKFNKYILSRLFPSYSQSVPLELRNAVRYLCHTEPMVRLAIGHTDYMTRLNRRFKDVFWPRTRLDDYSQSVIDEYTAWMRCPGARGLLLHNVRQAIRTILKYKDFNFPRAKKLADLRCYVTSKMFEHKTPHELYPIVYQLKRIREIKRSYELDFL